MPVSVWQTTHVVVMFSFLVRLWSIELWMLRLGQGLQARNLLVQRSKVLLDHVRQFGDLDRSVIKERFALRHYFRISLSFSTRLALSRQSSRVKGLTLCQSLQLRCRAADPSSNISRSPREF
jgi:hypothetical protein